MSETSRTFQITLPRLQWRILYTWKFVAALALLLCSAAATYWWREIRPFTTVPGGILHVATREIVADEEGKLSDVLQGDYFQAGEMLYSTQEALVALEARQLDQKLEENGRVIEDLQARIDQNMQQYVYLQNELEAQIGPTELTDQIWQEIQGWQEQLHSLEQEKSGLQAQRQELARQLDSQIALAPFEGMVLERYKQAGQRVRVGDLVLLICDKEKRWIEAEIEEKLLSTVRSGTPARIEFLAFPGQRWDAQVSWISPVVTSGKVKIHLSADLLPLRPGLSAKTQIRIH